MLHSSPIAVPKRELVRTSDSERGPGWCERVQAPDWLARARAFEAAPGWLAACLVRATASADRTFQEASVYRKRRVYRKTLTLRRRRGVSGPRTVRPQLRILIFSVQPNAHHLSRPSERVSAAASTSHTAKYTPYSQESEKTTRCPWRPSAAPAARFGDPVILDQKENV